LSEAKIAISYSCYTKLQLKMLHKTLISFIVYTIKQANNECATFAQV